MDDIKQYPIEAQSEHHAACVLLLDTSSSMSGDPIERLNQGLAQFKRETLSKLQGLKSKAIDIAIVEFNDEVRIVQNFAPINEMKTPKLQAKGMTAMGAGMRKALDLQNQRKNEYKANGTPYFRPMIFMITDGGPNDDYAAVFEELQQLEDGKHVMTWAVGVEGYNEELLRQIMPWYEVEEDGVKQKRRRIYRLEGMNFSELFEFLSNSIAGLVNSNPGEFKGIETPSSLKQADNPQGW